jgi:predicted membrane protein
VAPMFFGLVVILFGLSILLEGVFHIDIPVFRIAVGLLLLYLGARMLLNAFSGGRRYDRSDDAAVFSERTYAPSPTEGERLKYDIIFGRGVVDLTKTARDGADRRVEVNAIFGSATVKIDPTVPLEVEVNAAFGDARLPDHSTTALGSFRYRPPGQGQQTPKLHLKINVVFGSCLVIELPAPPPAA